MGLTDFTRTIGDTIAKIKNNNKLIDELNKKFNPTFVEIIENLQKTDPTLAKMLMVWYMETYSIDDKELETIVNKYQKKPKKTRETSHYTFEDYTCGSSRSSGCGSTYYSSSGGCGSSSNSSRC